MGSVLFTVTDFTACRVSVPVVRTVSQFHSPIRPASDRSDRPLTDECGHFATRARICPMRGAGRDTMQGDAIKEFKACVN